MTGFSLTVSIVTALTSDMCSSESSTEDKEALLMLVPFAIILIKILQC